MASSSSHTPLMRQYLEWKSRHSDAILMFRLGDFYEMFYDDAVKAAKSLDLTLTTRDKNKKDPVPMCGVPHHTLNTYVSRLVEMGHKVAICEQVEDPKRAKGIVRREVTQVVTPGVILDLDHLEARKANYLAAIWPFSNGGQGKRKGEGGGSFADWSFGLAYADVSTGEFRVTEVEDGDGLRDELARISPRQALFPEGMLDLVGGLCPEPRPMVEERPDHAFEADPEAGLDRAAEALGESPKNLRHLPIQTIPAVTAVLEYLQATLGDGRVPPLRIVPYERGEFLVLDEATLANLEVFETLMEGRRAGSLLATIDETVTPMGGRALRRALAFPLQDVGAISRRHDAVEHLLEHPSACRQARRILKHVYDLERLGQRLSHGVATAKDLVALRVSLEILPELEELLAGIMPGPEELDPGRDLSVLDLSGDLLDDVAEAVRRAIVDDPPATMKAGGVIRPGYDEQLDRLVETSRGGKDRILAIEERERSETGIGSLKVKYNKVFGYYIEVTKANLQQVPDHYTRKQTLVNSERFVTPELAEHEALVLEAEERRLELEERLFSQVRERLRPHADRVAALASRIAMVDLMTSFAETAATRDFVRPEISADSRLSIVDGRHPVVEHHRESGTFVPNDTIVDHDDQQVLIITGPNMAGKSTIIRQVAIIALLAHTGSFVPAKEATVGLVDRIFTRVGASDNLARGESTFMVEMKETANILRYATKRSLVILDEIGRGTSTFDGMSLAWAVAEYLHDRIGARTLFATHYHELCELARVKPRVRNFAVMVREWNEEIVFLHKLSPGGVNRSYGIQVAKLAGLPEPVISRALHILEDLERGESLRMPGSGDVQLDLFGQTPAGRARRRSESGEEPCHEQETSQAPPDSLTRLADTVQSSHPDDLSPRQAHELLYRLHELLESD